MSLQGHLVVSYNWGGTRVAPNPSFFKACFSLQTFQTTYFSLTPFWEPPHFPQTSRHPPAPLFSHVPPGASGPRGPQLKVISSQVLGAVVYSKMPLQPSCRGSHPDGMVPDGECWITSNVYSWSCGKNQYGNWWWSMAGMVINIAIRCYKAITKYQLYRRMWVKQCHKPPMTGNGNHTTYRNGDDWRMVYYWFTHITCLLEILFWHRKGTTSWLDGIDQQKHHLGVVHMGVSINGGTPKWRVSKGKSHQNGWFGGYPHLWKPSYGIKQKLFGATSQWS